MENITDAQAKYLTHLIECLPNRTTDAQVSAMRFDIALHDVKMARMAELAAARIKVETHDVLADNFEMQLKVMMGDAEVEQPAEYWEAVAERDALNAEIEQEAAELVEARYVRADEYRALDITGLSKAEASELITELKG